MCLFCNDIFIDLYRTHVKIIIYTANDGKTKIDVKFEEKTLWLTRVQAYGLYQTDKSNVSGHISSNGRNA